jgi:hypothetical protein
MVLNTTFAWLQDADGGARRTLRVPRQDMMKPIGSEGMRFEKTMRHHVLRLTCAFPYMLKAVSLWFWSLDRTVTSSRSHIRCL